MMSVFRFFNCGTTVSSCRNLLTSRLFHVCEQQQAILSDKVLKQLGIPEPPKRPLNPFLRFSYTVRSKIAESNPSLLPQEVMKKIGEEWHKYDPEKKKEWQKEYLSEMEVYLSNMEKYKKSITPEQQELIESTKEKKVRAIERTRKNQKIEKLGKPKKPISGYLRFMNEKRAQRNDNVKYVEWVKSVGKEWENMSESEKQVYRDKTKLEMIKYQSDLLQWEQDMIRQGHIDVVRNKDLLQSNQSKKTSNNTTTS